MMESVKEDDFVEYSLFCPWDSKNSNEETEEEAHLRSYLDLVDKTVGKYTRDYLWHKDPFKLSPRTSIINNYLNSDNENSDSTVDTSLPPHLYGISHIGDNIEDEWFIVFLLQQITKEIPGVVAKVGDIDGEFLLIEAADFLPKWANPETCENRVFIVNGEIHLIPPSPNKTPTITHSLQALNTEHTLAHPDIQNSIHNKTKKYPHEIHGNLHNSVAYLPIAVAATLVHKPHLISAAVHAFCNRDPIIDLKACKAMKYFPPENRVKSGVKFTRCLYAMLVHSKYVPDRRTGWNLPPRDSSDFKSWDLGCKVASGFEILVSEAARSRIKNASWNLEGDRSWLNYVNRLKERGYFKDLLEHSVEHNKLLNKAKEYYMKNCESMHYMPSIGLEVLDFIKTLDQESLLEDFNNCNNEFTDDDDSWLNIGAEDLDKILHEKYGTKYTSVNNNSDASSFSSKITEFLNQKSDYEGAEFDPKGKANKKNKAVSFAEDLPPPTATSNKINFNPDNFASAVQNILNFMIPEDDSFGSDSDMSDYERDGEDDLDDLSTAKRRVDSCDDDKKMREYMEEMDRELAGTTIGKSFVQTSVNDTKQSAKPASNDLDSDDDEPEDDFRPVDIDVNALKNILESYKLQMGDAGPSSTMLGPMGIHLDTKNE